LTLRKNTERPVTLTEGTNRLVGSEPDQLATAGLETLRTPRSAGRMPELWDGRAAARIIDILQVEG
jgi:UDP-N-acetylglucosamine 2-epimerase (non-hydrolysing)